MTELEAYEQSKKLRALVHLSKDLLQEHLTRYCYFVDNSPSGIECTFAKQCFELIELHELREKIRDLSTRCQELERELFSKDL